MLAPCLFVTLLTFILFKIANGIRFGGGGELIINDMELYLLLEGG